MIASSTTAGRRPRCRRRVALAALAALSLAACGREVPPPGAPRPAGPRIARRLEAADLFPSDLDLAVRVDVARMRAGLGPAAVEDLAARGLSEVDDDALRLAIARAEVVWVALRLADLDVGDRVVVVEGKMKGIERDPAVWEATPSDIDGVTVADRRGGAPRAGTARILAVRDRAMAFVSPVEVSSVDRVLRDGPDAERCDPAAEGLVSLDLRARRLPPRLEKRFPSLGALIAGLERVRAVAALADEGVVVEAQIIGRSAAGAAKARRFLEALRDNVADPRYAQVVKALSIEQVERAVRVRWPLPARAVLALMSGGEGG